MSEPKNQNPPPPAPSSTSASASNSNNNNNKRSNWFNLNGEQKVNYPNPPDATNPDAATLRDQWRFAIRQYSRWYSHAWGTAILAGLSFFALGWIIKGSNPLPSFRPHPPSSSSEPAEPDPHNKPNPSSS